MYYGGATQGMRTMLDALVPATEVYSRLYILTLNSIRIY